MNKVFFISVLVLSQLLGVNSYAQKSCKGVIPTKVAVNIKGVEFVFLGVGIKEKSLKASLHSLLEMLSAGPSIVGRVALDQKILELEEHYISSVGGELAATELYRKIRELRAFYPKAPGAEASSAKPDVSKIKRSKWAGAKKAKLLGGDEEWVMGMVGLSNGGIIAGRAGRIVEVWQEQDSTYKRVDSRRRPDLMLYNGVELHNGWLALGGYGRHHEIWKLKDGLYEHLQSLRHDTEAKSLTQLRDGRLVLGNGNGTLGIWVLKEGVFQEVAILGQARRLNDWVRSITELKDGRLVIAGGIGGAAQLWDLDGEFYKPGFFFGEHKPESIIQLQDGKILIKYSLKAEIGELVGDEYQKLAEFSHLKWSDPVVQLQTGELVMGFKGGNIQVWEETLGSFKEVAEFRGHTDQVTSILELPDGRFATGSHDYQIYIWSKNMDDDKI